MNRFIHMLHPFEVLLKVCLAVVQRAHNLLELFQVSRNVASALVFDVALEFC